MTETKDTVEREVSDAVKGAGDATPLILQTGVFLIVGAAVSLIVGIVLLVYFLA